MSMIRLAILLICGWQLAAGAMHAQAQQNRMSAGQADGVLQFIGCFKDQGDSFGTKGRDLDGLLIVSETMTNAKCADLCRAGGYRYAGTQVGKQCFCGNAYGRSGPSPSCNFKCAGHPNEICGGPWANSVSRIGDR